MVYLPIALVVVTSFNQDTITTLPIEHLDTRWYAELFQDTKTLQSLWTSLQVGVVSTTLATALGLLSALAIVRHNFRGKSLFMLLTVMPMLAPGIIMGVSLLLFARYVGFQTGFVAVLLGHVLLALPYCTFILISSLARFDRSLEEAARGLGAGELAVLRRVTLPGIAAGHHRRSTFRLHHFDRRVRRQFLPDVGWHDDTADPDLLDRQGGNYAGDQCRVHAHPRGNACVERHGSPSDLVQTQLASLGGYA